MGQDFSAHAGDAARREHDEDTTDDPGRQGLTQLREPAALARLRLAVSSPVILTVTAALASPP